MSETRLRRLYKKSGRLVEDRAELSHTSTSPHHLAACWVHSDQTLKFQSTYRSWFNFDLGSRIFFFVAGFVDVYLRHGIATSDTTEETMFEAKCTTRLSVDRELTTLTRGESWPVAVCHIPRGGGHPPSGQDDLAHHTPDSPAPQSCHQCAGM